MNKKIALIFRHSIRTNIESGGLLTEEGKLAAQRIGSRIRSKYTYNILRN